MPKMTEPAFGKIAECKCPGPDPLKFDHAMAHMVEHPAYLPFPAFVDRDLEPRIGFFFSDLFDP
jgi:hypothetical protein